MAAMNCPQCESEMVTRDHGGVGTLQCPRCQGLFLRGNDRGLLVELENEWHLSSGPTTQPIPRISADMSAPAPTTHQFEARSFLDELFG